MNTHEPDSIVSISDPFRSGYLNTRYLLPTDSKYSRIITICRKFYLRIPVSADFTCRYPCSRIFFAIPKPHIRARTLNALFFSYNHTVGLAS